MEVVTTLYKYELIGAHAEADRVDKRCPLALPYRRTFACLTQPYLVEPPFTWVICGCNSSILIGTEFYWSRQVSWQYHVIISRSQSTVIHKLHHINRSLAIDIQYYSSDYSTLPTLFRSSFMAPPSSMRLYLPMSNNIAFDYINPGYMVDALKESTSLEFGCSSISQRLVLVTFNKKVLLPKRPATHQRPSRRSRMARWSVTKRTPLLVCRRYYTKNVPNNYLFWV